MPQPRYPSDLSDAEWAILEPLLSSAEKRGRPPKWPTRRVAEADFYLLRSGCAWRMPPREYPPWQTVYYHFRKWRLDGRLRQAHDRLREAEGRAVDPSAAVIDSQAVKTTRVGGPERGLEQAQSASPGASATSSWWTRMGLSWPRGSTAPTSPTGTAVSGCWPKGCSSRSCTD